VLPELEVLPALDVLPELLAVPVLPVVALVPVLAVLLEVLPPVLVPVLPVAGAVTWIENGGSEAVELLPLAAITMFEYSPVSAVEGIPESSPVETLKLAQPGLLLMLKETGLPLAFG